MNSLRQECKQRLKVAFDSIRVVSDTVNFILIVDNYGLKVLSNTIKMMELINYGITIVERLELERKRYSKIEAVYLISPKSFQKMLEDFPDGKTPQYKSIHILSLSKISEGMMNTLSSDLNIARRIKTLKQINFGFSLHSHNQVKLCNYQENSFQLSLEKSSDFVESTIDQLSSVLTTFSTFYIVEIYYQKPNSTSLAERVATGLKQKIQSLFRSFEKNSVPNYNSSAPLTTFLILDRSYDSVSPLIRDYHYGPLFYDVKNIKNHKVTDFGKDKKVLTLNQNDQIFDKYKNMHIGAALKGIPADFDQFSHSHAAAKFHKGDQESDLDMNKLNEVMKKMPQYMDVKDRYVLHYETLEEIMKNMKAKKWHDQGYLEQSILSLINQDGKKVKEKDAISNLIKVLEQTSDDREKAKLVLIGLMCLEIKAKDQGMLTKFLKDTRYEGIEKNIQKLQGLSVCRLNQKKEQKGNEILDKHEPKLEDIVRQISNQSHGDLKILRVGAADKTSKPMAKSHMGIGLKKIRVNEDKKERPRLIVFFNSAIGYNEMRAISQYESMYHIIYVSHNFVTPNQYLDQINAFSVYEQELEL